MFLKLLSNVLCVNPFYHQMVRFFEAVLIGVKSGPGWTSWALFKEVPCVNPLLPPNGLFEAASICLSFVQRWVVHAMIICEKSKLSRCDTHL